MDEASAVEWWELVDLARCDLFTALGAVVSSRDCKARDLTFSGRSVFAWWLSQRGRRLPAAERHVNLHHTNQWWRSPVFLLSHLCRVGREHTDTLRRVLGRGHNLLDPPTQPGEVVTILIGAFAIAAQSVPV